MKRGGSLTTVAQQYKGQLNDLMDTLQKTNPHFIRCIIPNHKKVPLEIDDEIVLEQLRCNGVLQGIKISRDGYPNRLKYQVFLKRYYLLGNDIPKKAPDAKSAVELLVKQLTEQNICDPSKIQFGLTKIFFRVGELNNIEGARGKKISNLLPTLQAFARGFLSRKIYKYKRERGETTEIIQRAVRAWLEFKNWKWYTLYKVAKPQLQKEDVNKMIKDEENKVAVIKKELEGVEKERDSNAKIVSDLTNKINDLKNDISSEKTKSETLDTNKSNSTEDNLKLNNKLQDLDENLKAQNQEVKDTDTVVKDLQSKIKDNESRLGKNNSNIKGLLSDIKKIRRRYEQC